jgi:sugar O-acyltransferase (sialic acid O-acetyltransferase NeuD family)
MLTRRARRARDAGMPNKRVTKQRVVIFGLGDFAEVAHAYLSRAGRFEVAAFTVHERYIEKPDLFGLDVVPFERLEERFPPTAFAMFVAVGFRRLNRARTEVYEECKRRGYELISYVSPQATRFPDVKVGDNCFVFEGNVIQPFVEIGNNVVIWCGNHIGHHVVIGDNCFIASHAVISGRVRIGSNCFIGVNATIRDGVRVGRDCIVGAGALIVKDTEDRAVFRGAATPPADVRSDQLDF